MFCLVFLAGPLKALTEQNLRSWWRRGGIHRRRAVAEMAPALQAGWFDTI